MDWNWSIYNLTKKQTVDTGVVFKGLLNVDYVVETFSTFLIQPSSKEIKKPTSDIWIITIQENNKIIFRGRIREFVWKQEEDVVNIKANSLFSFFGFSPTKEFLHPEYTTVNEVTMDEDYVEDQINSQYGGKFDELYKASINVKQNPVSLLDFKIISDENRSLQDLLLTPMFREKVSLNHKILNGELEFQFTKKEPIRLKTSDLEGFQLFESNTNSNDTNQVIVWASSGYRSDTSNPSPLFARCRFTLLKDGSVVSDLLDNVVYPNNIYPSETPTDKLKDIAVENRILPVVRVYTNAKSFSSRGSLSSPLGVGLKKATSIINKTTDSLYIKFIINKTKPLMSDLYKDIEFGNTIGQPVVINVDGVVFNSLITGFSYELGTNEIQIKIGAQRVALSEKLNKMQKAIKEI